MILSGVVSGYLGNFEYLSYLFCFCYLSTSYMSQLLKVRQIYMTALRTVDIK